MTGKEIREKITKLRLEHNLSEYALSQSLGQSPGYIQNITSGRSLPSMQVFLNICEFFEIEPSVFFEDPIPNDLQREIRKEMQSLPEEDLKVLLYIARKMKQKD